MWGMSAAASRDFVAIDGFFNRAAVRATPA
jgi:hypothetical protein